MTPLRKKFYAHLRLRHFTQRTIDSYMSAMVNLAKYFKQPPDQLTNEQIQQYLHFLITERKLAWSTVNVAFSAFRCFYQHTLGWNQTRFNLPPRPRVKQLPLLLSEQEVMRIIDAASNPKHRTLLMATYSAGLRVSEVTTLKPAHIDSGRMMICVEQGKGRKDRHTILSALLLAELRHYWKLYQPRQWLFFGHAKHVPMTISTAQKIYKQAARTAGITKGRGIHTLRHCFATHLLDHGVNIHLIKQMLGHSSIKTTAIYLHTTIKDIQTIKSPLDRILK